MRLYPEKLADQLQQQLLPVYLVSGDEPLLQQECCDLIRERARQLGCSDREVIDAGVSSFNWQDILHSATSMSLFAQRKLIELRLPSGKPGAQGSKALCEYLDIASGEDVLLISPAKSTNNPPTASGTRPWIRPAPLSRYGQWMPGNCLAGCNSAYATLV